MCVVAIATTAAPLAATQWATNIEYCSNSWLLFFSFSLSLSFESHLNWSWNTFGYIFTAWYWLFELTMNDFLCLVEGCARDATNNDLETLKKTFIFLVYDRNFHRMANARTPIHKNTNLLTTDETKTFFWPKKNAAIVFSPSSCILFTSQSKPIEILMLSQTDETAKNGNIWTYDHSQRLTFNWKLMTQNCRTVKPQTRAHTHIHTVNIVTVTCTHSLRNDILRCQSVTSNLHWQSREMG